MWVRDATSPQKLTAHYEPSDEARFLMRYDCIDIENNKDGPQVCTMTLAFLFQNHYSDVYSFQEEYQIGMQQESFFIYHRRQLSHFLKLEVG